jgi:hypothetical protein
MTGSNDAWKIIENERRRDRFIRGVCITAWVVAFLIVLIVAVLVGSSTLTMYRMYLQDAVPWMTVAGTMLPLVDVLWKLSLLVAALSTVLVFLRLRTASLAEIQMRLAALEELVSSRGGRTMRDRRSISPRHRGLRDVVRAGEVLRYDSTNRTPRNKSNRPAPRITAGERPFRNSTADGIANDSFSSIAATIIGRKRIGSLAMIRKATCHATATPTNP